MAHLEANPTLSVLIWARETSGLDVDLAAKKAGISADRLRAWESGRQKPTFTQLRKLSSIYRRPLAMFYLDKPPKGFAPMHDFRRVAHRLGGSTSPELTMEIRRAHDRREWALELFAQIETRPPRFNDALTLSREIETAASEVRRMLKVTVENQITWRTDYEAFKQWRLLVERAGILTFQASRVDVVEARGFSISNRPLPVAVTNIKDAPRARIFTLLHEIVHILLNDGGICDLHQSSEDQSSRIETFCNQVAGAALFPRGELLQTQTVRGHRRGNMAWTDEELAELSRRFGGSREAALVRLLSLELTTQAFYEKKREEFQELYAAQREREKEKGGFAPPLEVALTTAGPTFTSLVVENLNRDRITASDFSDYLQIRLKYLAEVQRDYPRMAV